MPDQFIYPLLSLVFLFLGFYLLRSAGKLKQTGISSTGTVKEIVNNYSTDSSDTSNNFYPVISFTTVEGKTINKQSNAGSNPSIYKVGQEVKIYYNSQNPEEFIIDNFLTTRLLPYGFIIIGFILIIIYLLLFI